MPKIRKWDRLIHDTGHEDVKVSLQQIPEWIEIKEELEKFLDDHKHWLKRDCEDWENMRADPTGTEATDFFLGRPGMNGCNLRGADLRGTDFYPNDKTLRTACITEALFTADARTRKDDKEENAGTKGNDAVPAEKTLHLEDLRDAMTAYVSSSGLFRIRREEDSKGSTVEDKGD